jgi:ABC transport system ATP-binding/permease protein
VDQNEPHSETGTDDAGVAVVPEPAAAPGFAKRKPIATHWTDGVLTIGRDESNDIVLPDLRASAFHAEIRRSGTGYVISDLGSTTGIHLNGRKVSRSALAQGDRVSVGRHDFVFDGTNLHEYIDIGPSSLFADDLTVQVGKQTLLDDVSFAVQEGSLVGVIGPSGCGKSTLIKAITGLRPANQGHVRYDGRSLYEEYANLRYRIGMVPQDDVLHRQLSVRRALRFSASLRFADDVPRRDRIRRVDEVVGLLGLADRAKQRISTLSGGQRKRTSVALELLTEPSLLCLDEPTSGLDPALDREVMRELRSLADRGRTVVVVTHSVLHLSMCDRVLVMCLGGRMGFFGPPEEVLDFFGAEDYADVFEMITNDAAGWSTRYRNSDAYRKHVGEVVLQLTSPAPAPPAAPPSVPLPAPTAPGVSAPAPVVPAQPGPSDVADSAEVLVLAMPETETSPEIETPSAASEAPAGSPGAATAPPAAGSVPAGAPTAPVPAPPRPRRGSSRNPVAPFRQFFTLSARMMAVIGSDRGYTGFLIGLPLILALLTHAVPGTKGLGVDLNYTLEAQRLIVVFIVGAAFMGIAGPIREIVQEAAIYGRERAVGVSPTAYLCSKLFVYLIIDIIQVSLFTKLALLGRPGPASPLVFKSFPMLEIIIPVTLVAFVSTVLGLLVSALVKTVDQTTPVLVVTVMAQLVLSGGLFELHGSAGLDQISWLSPSRWGLAANGATVDLVHKVIGFSDPQWAHTTSSWWRSIAYLLIEAIVLALLARLALKRHDPGKTN